MDLVLHFREDSADLGTLVSQTEKAFEDFPCRVLPVFTPWYPSTGDKPLPTRPLKSPPIIYPEEVIKIQRHILTLARELPESVHECSDTDGSPLDCGQTSLGRALVAAQTCPETWAPRVQSKDGVLDNKVKRRSWSVASQAQRGLLASPNSHTFSRQFHKIVCSHRLNLLQRAKWVINGHSCVAGDLEQAWRGVTRAMRNSKLPTCNANIQRSLGQIWVFCDVLHCEHVGKYLKDQLQLTGNITLSVHRLGDILSF
ncbi:shieldin complex subunit 3 [Osmerus eperlanus]|uniref:shieldin complex subunit 3 n=1 Tax=Osmerus eperlanus TaxID=29151 RepID=UPI002E161221